MSGVLAEMAAKSDHSRPDLWVWALLPAIGVSGSVIILLIGLAGRPVFSMPLVYWLWLVAFLLPLALFCRDVWHYHAARRRGRRAGWELRAMMANEATVYLCTQNERLAAGTVRVEPVRREESQRYALLRTGDEKKLLALESEAQAVRWLESPGGQKVEAESVIRFLRRAYRMRQTGRRAFVPDVMKRAEYDNAVAFLVDCGLLSDGGAAGRSLVLPSLAEAETHLGLGGHRAQPSPPSLPAWAGEA